VTIQAQIIDLVKRLRMKSVPSSGLHDLVVAGLAHRVIVMYAGYIVEEAPVKELYQNPRHPYTLGLLGSLPAWMRNARKTQIHRGFAARPD
jgi:ABC-type dipeptide/oligopeptide/nickel transport system ATPase component